MDYFTRNFPTGDGLIVYAICLVLGGFVLYKYCLDQFGKRCIPGSDNESWKFILVQYQTSPRQYINGFSTYASIMLLIFVVASAVGPGPIAQIIKTLTAAPGLTSLSPAEATAPILLRDYPAFPIVVAFCMVGLNPNVPKSINFEEFIRGFAHRVAYIPSNMDRLLNYMTFANISMPDDKIDRAWYATDLQRPDMSAPDVKELAPTINRLVLLYASAATMADDARFPDIRKIAATWRTDVFKQYRAEIENVSVAMQAIIARLADLPDAATAAGDRKRVIEAIRREAIKNLDLLYAIIGAAINAQETGRTTDRLLAFGFDSPYPPKDGVPWDPVLKAVGAAAAVLITAGLIGTGTFIGTGTDGIPDTVGDMLQLIGIVLIVHLAAVARALSKRATLIRQDRYFDEAGQDSAVSYFRIFVSCYVICLLLNVLLYSFNLAPALMQVDQDSEMSSQQIISYFIVQQMVWSAVPAFCGAMTALTLDRPSLTYSERTLSAAIEGGGMALVALLSVALTLKLGFEYRCFVSILYGGLGFVLGFMLPAAIRRHREAQLSRLPEQISVLRNSVLHYFRDFQQFGEWLNAGDPDLDGKRPRDVLMEQNGLQRLISLVNTNRPPLGASGA